VSEAVEAYRRGHRLGNYILTALVLNIFGRQFTDMLSGYISRDLAGLRN
jgi:hypothetical protein